jgi:hypothetical protein
VLAMELKRAGRLVNGHTTQCLNYLRASSRSLRLLVNFQNPTPVEANRLPISHN